MKRAEINISSIISTLIGVILIILVLVLQIMGYYHRIYYSVTIEGQVIKIGQTNEMEWNNLMGQYKSNPYIESSNYKGSELLWINSTGKQNS